MPREMKDSGIEWIGNAPKNWVQKKIKHILIRDEKKNLGNLPVLSVYREYGVIPKDSRTDNHNVTSDDTSNYKYVKPDYLVINKMKAWQGSMGISNYEGIVSPAYFIYRFSDNTVHKKYIHHLFRIVYKDEFKRISTGIREGQWDLPALLFENEKILLPPFEEQKQIADFLDYKCDEIDALHADIEKQIAILEDYKKSIITEAVTKGLNPGVEMKDSGIEWIDTIPKTWIVSRLNYECYIRARLGWKGLKADEYVQEGYPFLSAFNIQNNHLVWFPLNFITQKRYDESPEIKLKIGDILLVKDGAGIGKTARIDTLPFNAATTNSSLGVLTPYSSLNYRYLSYYLQSAIFSNFINRLLNGMGVPHLTQEVLNKIKILIPSLHEQQEIADYLDQKTTEIDAIISAKKQQLDVLDNYKKSLIYEYVTGKKEVPSYANAE